MTAFPLPRHPARPSLARRVAHAGRAARSASVNVVAGLATRLGDRVDRAIRRAVRPTPVLVPVRVPVPVRTTRRRIS